MFLGRQRAPPSLIPAAKWGIADQHPVKGSSDHQTTGGTWACDGQGLWSWASLVVYLMRVPSGTRGRSTATGRWRQVPESRWERLPVGVLPEQSENTLLCSRCAVNTGMVSTLVNCFSA